jgi:hypothetical protein
MLVCPCCYDPEVTGGACGIGIEVPDDVEVSLRPHVLSGRVARQVPFISHSVLESLGFKWKPLSTGLASGYWCFAGGDFVCGIVWLAH